MNLITSPLKLAAILEVNAVNKVLETNEESQYYGLVLTAKDARELIETRCEALRANGRIEIGSDTINKIISTFCNSYYIWQANYTQTLHDLLETFYYMKNETLDIISDDELIKQMKFFFENQCGGSIELLQGRYLENFARQIRYGITSHDQLEEDFNNTDIEDGEDY